MFFNRYTGQFTKKRSIHVGPIINLYRDASSTDGVLSNVRLGNNPPKEVGRCLCATSFVIANR